MQLGAITPPTAPVITDNIHCRTPIPWTQQCISAETACRGLGTGVTCKCNLRIQ